MSFLRIYSRFSMRNLLKFNKISSEGKYSYFPRGAPSQNSVQAHLPDACVRYFSLLSAGREICPIKLKSRCTTRTSINEIDIDCNQQRGYAKKKDKGGGKKGGGKKVTLSNDELSQIISYNKMLQQMDEVIEHLKQDYVKQLSVRSNMGSFEHLLVETDDGKFPLKQIAQIAQKSPTLIAINCGAMSQYLPAVKNALEKSGMNINPQMDKNSIFVPLPKVTREHRETLAKAAKTLSDRSKDKLKEVHNRYQKDAKKKTGASDDLVRNVVETIHDKLHEYQADCDSLMKKKQDELLQK